MSRPDGPDYAALYSDYWSRPDRWKSHSFADGAALARRVLAACGGGSILDVGCGMGLLVRRLLREGVDAHGVDVAPNAVDACNALCPGRFHRGSLLALPFADGAFDSVVSTDVLEHLAEQDVPKALAEMRRVARRSVFLVLSTEADRDGTWHLTMQGREWWDRQAYAAGLRRHPLFLSLVAYGELEQERGQITLLYEPIPAALESRWPSSALAEHSMLHRDMLRDTGRRADAHLARYHLACSLVRPGDVVLDVACGLGYGSAMLAAGSSAARVIGVDGARHAIEYARDAYGASSPLVEFRAGDACELDFLGPDSIDLAVSFETLEHLEDPERFLAELERVLKPGARIVASVPNDWSDESGTDPSPYHLHVYTWDKLSAQIGRRFRIERAFAQVAGGARKLPEGRRSLRQVPLEPQPDAPAEWWLVAAMKDPRRAARVEYRETSFPDLSRFPDYNLSAFGRDYDHPWLVKGMVSIGMRTTNERDLRALAADVLASARPGSADAGAALCVLAYRALAEEELQPGEIEPLLDRIRDYHERADDSAHAWRWRVSNQYAAGHLELALGRRDRALEAFLACGSMDACRFAPILATKTVDALYFAGRIAASSGDEARARSAFESALRTAESALRGHDWLNVLGTPEQPVVFGLPEAAQVLDFAARAAYALDALGDWSRRPAHAWQRATHSQLTQLEHVRRVVHDWEALYVRRAAEMDAEIARVRAVERAACAQREAELAAARAEAERARAELERVRNARLVQRGIAFAKRHAPAGSLRHRVGRAVLVRARSVKRALRGGAPAADGQPLRRGVAALARDAARGAKRGLRAAGARASYLPLAWRLSRELRPAGASARRVVALQVGSFDKGGLEEVVLTLARNLSRAGSVGVVVFVADGPIGHLGEKARADGIQVVALHRNPLLLRRILRTVRVDVASLHYSIFGVREYARAGVPIVYTIHNTYVWANEGFARERAEAYALTERFLAVSEPAGRFFAARLGIDPARIEVVPNGLDPELLAGEVPATRASFGLAEDDVVFLNAASFNWNKFHVLMVAAMERLVRTHPRAKLFLVGNTHDRACREHVEAQVREKGLEQHVRVLEYVPKAELVGMMRIADCFLLPSLIEGWSIAVLEAMHCGLPLILSDVGSARAVIEDEDVGIVVPNPFPDVTALTNEAILRDYTLEPKLANLDALVAAMRRVVEDPAGWKARGAGGRAKVRERYTAQRMCEQYLACFEAVAAVGARG